MRHAAVDARFATTETGMQAHVGLESHKGPAQAPRLKLWRKERNAHNALGHFVQRLITNQTFWRLIHRFGIIVCFDTCISWHISIPAQAHCMIKPSPNQRAAVDARNFVYHDGSGYLHAVCARLFASPRGAWVCYQDLWWDMRSRPEHYSSKSNRLSISCRPTSFEPSGPTRRYRGNCRSNARSLASMRWSSCPRGVSLCA